MPTISIYVAPALRTVLERQCGDSTLSRYASGLLWAAVRAGLSPVDSGVVRGRVSAAPDKAPSRLLRAVAQEGEVSFEYLVMLYTRHLATYQEIGGPPGTCVEGALRLMASGILEWVPGSNPAMIRIKPRTEG